METVPATSYRSYEIAQSSLFRNGNPRWAAGSGSAPLLNLPYLGMETNGFCAGSEIPVLLNLPYLGMETRIAAGAEGPEGLLNLPYLGMETHF